MPLQSQLFRGVPQLESCATSDAAHVTPGARGDHVLRIQQALNALDGAGLNPDGAYGPATASAVLSYKRKRGIINRSYQTQPDDIVGRMTIAALDREMQQKEAEDNGGESCIYRMGTGSASARGLAETPVRLAVTGPVSSTENDERLMQAARARSIVSIRTAITMLNDLRQAIARQRLPLAPPLTAAQQAVLNTAATWLHVNPGAPFRTLITLASAVSLMERNIAVRNSKGVPPTLKRTTIKDFGVVRGGDVENGVECGDSFFDFGGPNCHRDVMTHEFFHFLGINHGGGAPDAPTPRAQITTSAQALDSADNLAQMIAELTTPGGKTDACARRSE